MSFITPETKHHFAKGIYAKESFIPADSMVMQHNHTYDHISILAVGSVELVVDDVKTVIHGPACLTIEAKKHHGIKALTDTVWYCIHASNCTNEDEVDNTIIEPSNNDQVIGVLNLLEK